LSSYLLNDLQTGLSSVIPQVPTHQHTTLAVDDTLFNENLGQLFDRRLLAAQALLDTLDYERGKLHNRHQLI
jgi:hypothetical protein